MLTRRKCLWDGLQHLYIRPQCCGARRQRSRERPHRLHHRRPQHVHQAVRRFLEASQVTTHGRHQRANTTSSEKRCVEGQCEHAVGANFQEQIGVCARETVIEGTHLGIRGGNVTAKSDEMLNCLNTIGPSLVGRYFAANHAEWSVGFVGSRRTIWYARVAHVAFAAEGLERQRFAADARILDQRIRLRQIGIARVSCVYCRKMNSTPPRFSMKLQRFDSGPVSDVACPISDTKWPIGSLPSPPLACILRSDSVDRTNQSERKT